MNFLLEDNFQFGKNIKPVLLLKLYQIIKQIHF